ncbi:hypothetical protein CVS40_5886 [Lucilia cuprina]|nr:hypothetical protein CVS40_5886 [Lucilia cuprina]
MRIDSLDSMPGCSVSAIVEEIGNVDSEPCCILSDIAEGIGNVDCEPGYSLSAVVEGIGNADSEPGCSLSVIVGEIDSEDSETEFVGIDNENLEPSEIIGNNSNFQRNSDIKGKCEEIKSWAVRNKISQTALEDLLHTLKRVGVEDLPLSAKTLLVQNFFLSGSFEYLYGKDEVLIDVGVDGLKLFKSSNRVLWPILGKIVGFDNVSPFMIGCFSGFKKPQNLNSFMADFCAEVMLLREHGVKVGNREKLLKFNVRLFICDSPARAFVAGVVSHNSKNGCSKCCQEGLYKERRVCFLKEASVPRTDITFQFRCHPFHHSEEFREKRSVLEDSGFEMVSQFPLDSMHLVDLGVTKKLLKLLVNKKNAVGINKKICFVAKYVPSEFCRTPRSLDEISNWKSTEFRQFLLYTGIYILKDCVSSDQYYHFLLLHSAIRLLSSEMSHIRGADISQRVLEDFVVFFGRLYGDELISFNVHGLLHLAECVKQFGPLDSFSAYKFENYMQYIKGIVKKPNKILQQIFLRLEERQGLNSNLVSKLGSFSINHKKEKDSFCFSKELGPMKVVSVVNLDEFVCKIFQKTENYFEEPFQSFSDLGIVVGSSLSTETFVVKREDIDLKYFCIPFDNKFLLIPLLHHLFHEFSH